MIFKSVTRFCKKFFRIVDKLDKVAKAWGLVGLSISLFLYIWKWEWVTNAIKWLNDNQPCSRWGLIPLATLIVTLVFSWRRNLRKVPSTTVSITDKSNKANYVVQNKQIKPHTVFKEFRPPDEPLLWSWSYDDEGTILKDSFKARCPKCQTQIIFEPTTIRTDDYIGPGLLCKCVTCNRVDQLIGVKDIYDQIYRKIERLIYTDNWQREKSIQDLNNSIQEKIVPSKLC